MYCGDETGAFVGELGSHNCRFGYGGEDCPKSVFASYMYHNGAVPTSTHHLPPQKAPAAADTSPNTTDVPTPKKLDFQDVIPIYNPPPPIYATNNYDSDCNPDSHLNDGIVQNWDAWENAWFKAFDDLAVRNYGKHTTGSVRVPTQRNTKRKFATVDDENEISSSLITKSNEDKEHADLKLMHPILSIDSGYTYLNDTSSSSINETGPNYQQSLKQKQRATMMEILFESLSAPAAFIAPTPMLASFATGRQNSLVVDIGAAGTRVTPLVDGLLLENAQRRNGRGGDWLGCVQRRTLEEWILPSKSNTINNSTTAPMETDDKNNNMTNNSVNVGLSKNSRGVVHPRYAINREKYGKVQVQYPSYTNVQQSIFHRLAVRDTMFEMKTSPHIVGVSIFREQDWSVPFVDDYSEAGYVTTEDQEGTNDGDIFSDDEEEYEDKAKKYYELPDGTRVNLQKNRPNKDLCRIPELFFSDDIPFFPSSSSSPSSPSSSPALPISSTSSSSTNPNITQRHHTLSTLPIHDLVKESLSAVADADVRKELCGNIILTGAASLFPKMEQRLSLQLSHAIPSMYRCKVIASRNTMERRHAAWIGGSILTSLGSFQQMWLSRTEYDEYGIALGSQKFP